MMSRSCRYYAALLLLLGMSCAWAAGAPDPRTTVLPIYQLPASAAVDGKLGEWAHVPVSDDQLIYCAEKNAALVAPSENIAVSLRCGRVAGKPDLYFLIVVKDSILLSREAHYWVEPDYLELYFDLFREKRTAEDPEWRLRKFFKPPAMGQFGLRPLCMNATPTLVANNVARPWKLDYACVPIEGGVAYEIRLDGQSVLANLKDDLHAADLPPVIGFDIGVGDLDSPVILRAATWNNLEIFYRFFGDFLNHDTPVHYGGLSTKPLPVPRGKAVPIKTLEQLYGAKPTARQVVKCINTLPDAQLADLVRWAVIQGVPLNADLLTPLFAAPMPRAQEAALLALYYHREQADAVRLAVRQTYARHDRATPTALMLANLLNLEMHLNLRDALPALLLHDDLRVFVSTAQVLEQCGTAEDVKTMIAARDTLLAKLAACTDADSPANKQRKAVYEEQFAKSLAALRTRTAP